MIHALAAEIIRQAAQAAGLPEGRVIDQPKADNLTLPRPRLELQFLPEKYRRSGRKLHIGRTREVQIRKRELFTVDLSVAANVLADNDAWLAGFCYDFTRLLPRGVNDSRGNWVKIQPEKASFGRSAAPRVGSASIEVFHRINQLYHITFIWRVTDEEMENLIQTFTINPIIKGV